MVAWNTSIAYGIVPTAYKSPERGAPSNLDDTTDGDWDTLSIYPAGVVGTGDWYRGWEFDLGSVQWIDHITVVNHPLSGGGTTGGNPEHLQYSSDGSTWTTVSYAFDTEDPTPDYWDDNRTQFPWVPGASIQARYIRVYLIQPAVGPDYITGLNLVELLVKGGDAPAVEPKVTLTIGGTEIERPTEIRCRVELNAAGSGYFRIAKSDAQATEAILARGSTCAVTFPEIDPDPIFEFFLQDGDFALIGDPEGAEELAFSGPGTLSYLARAVLDYVEYESGAGQVQLSKGRWRFDENGTEGKIIDKMLREAQSASRPSDPIPALTWTFTTTVDSDGASWDNEVLEGYWYEKIGTNLLSAVLRLVRANLLSIEMAPGFVLNAYRDLGEDRTGSAFGAGVIRFARAVNIAAELSRSMAGITFASHGVVRYADGSYTRAVKDGGTPYDQEAYFESNAGKAATARRQAKGQMKLREDAQESLIFAHRVPWPGAGNDEASGVYLPGPSWSDNGLYWVGDLVTLHTGTEDFEYDNATKRVYAITLAADATGYLAPPIVELNAPYRRNTAANEGLGSVTGASGDVTIIGGSTTVAASDAGGAFWKEPVRCVVTTDVTVATALNDGDSAGGVTLAAGDRVLLIGQTDASENGIYQAGDAPSRTSDFDASDEVAGAIIYVREGTGAGRIYRCTNVNEPVIDTDDITFGSAFVPVESTSDPTVDDDVEAGYFVGQLWINTSSLYTFLLVDNTAGAAVWTLITTGAPAWSFATSDGVTTVDPTTELTFVGPTLTDLGAGVAELTFAVPALDDLTDVVAAAPDDGDVLTWDDYLGAWSPAAPAGGAMALDDLTDVDAAAPDDGDLLSWDDGAGEWVPVAPPSGSVPDGTDPGDLLVWDGAAWDVLPIGADDLVLVADSGETLGVKWAAGGGGSVPAAVSSAALVFGYLNFR